MYQLCGDQISPSYSCLILMIIKIILDLTLYNFAKQHNTQSKMSSM